MFLPLFIQISMLILACLVELLDFLLLLDHTGQIVYKSLIFSATFTILDFLQICHSLIVGLCAIAIDVLPVLRPLLCVLDVAFYLV